jgi:hypothetical protein
METIIFFKKISFSISDFLFQLNFLVTGGHDGSRERNLSVGNIGEKLNIVSIETYKHNNDSMVRNSNKLEPKLFVLKHRYTILIPW